MKTSNENYTEIDNNEKTDSKQKYLVLILASLALVLIKDKK
jgi:hypothetical protein